MASGQTRIVRARRRPEISEVSPIIGAFFARHPPFRTLDVSTLEMESAECSLGCHCVESGLG
jgi:hypothetical protein